MTRLILVCLICALSACGGVRGPQTAPISGLKQKDVDKEALTFSNKMQLANSYSGACPDIRRSGANNSDAINAFYNEMFRRGYAGEQVNKALATIGQATQAERDADFTALLSARGLTGSSTTAELCAAAKRDILQQTFVGQMIEVRG